MAHGLITASAPPKLIDRASAHLFTERFLELELRSFFRGAIDAGVESMIELQWGNDTTADIRHDVRRNGSGDVVVQGRRSS
jgi:hypothetical protein